MTEAPEPLTPEGCDLRDFPRLMIDVPRLFASGFNATASRNPLAWMIGHKLWYRSWHQVPAGSLPADDDELCHLAELGFDRKSFDKAKALAMRGWVRCTDGRLYHPVVCEAALESWQEKLRQRLSSGAGNEKRWKVAFDSAPVAADLAALIACMERLNPQSKAIMKARKSLAGIASAIPEGCEDDPTGKEEVSQWDNVTPGTLSQETGTGTGILKKEKSFALVAGEPPTEAGKVDPETVRQAFAGWNDLAKRVGLPVARDLTDDRRKRIAVRLRAVGVDGWKSVLATIEASAFCRGGGDRGWRISLDDLFQTKTWNKLWDGGYGAVKAGPQDIQPETWAQLVAMWRAGEAWPAEAGPAPDQPGTRVPKHLLIQPLKEVA